MNSAKFKMKFLLFLFYLSVPVLATEYMPTHEIQAGMKGIGKTVFQGTQVDSFEVEILGVMRNVRPRGDIIIARLSGGPLEKTGIIAGMSGSPVYIHGKLIGALAFAWPFSKEPIAGITPISEMLQIVQWVSRLEGEEDQEMGMVEDLKFEISEDILSHNDLRYPHSTFEMTPIQTPLILSGFDERSLKDARQLFEPLGLLPVQGGIAGEENSPDADALVPGSAVGVQLISGDARAGALGTVTERKGKQILAFGHPFLWTGEVDFPMTKGYIHSILPSQVISFKMGSPGKVVGRLIQDRRAGIFGKIGEYSKMIPVDITIHRTDHSKSKGSKSSKLQSSNLESKFHYEIISHRGIPHPPFGSRLRICLWRDGNEDGSLPYSTFFL